MTKLTQEHIKNFLEQGYFILKGIFTEQEMESIENYANKLEYKARNFILADDQIHKIMDGGTQFVIQSIDGVFKIHRIVWAGATEPYLLNISRKSELLNAVSQILQSNYADHLINQLHFKFSNDGVKFSSHQDIHHRKNYDSKWENVNGERSYVVCVTAIDPMTEVNGPLMVIRGSNKLGELIRSELHNQFNEQNATPIILDIGDTVCMHQYLVHYSLPNESDTPRKVLINGFSSKGANHEQYPGEESAKLIELSPPLDNEL